MNKKFKKRKYWTILVYSNFLFFVIRTITIKELIIIGSEAKSAVDLLEEVG